MNGFDPNEGYLRHLILNSLRTVIRTFKGEYGPEIVIACDSRPPYWRDDIFPWYKWKRRQQKDQFIKDMAAVCSKVKDEFKEHLPYKVLEVPGAEADDIIAVVVRNNAMKEVSKAFGSNEESKPILIVSKDEDFLQLQKYSIVRQWNNTKKEFMVSSNPTLDLKNKILEGEPGTRDGIPNVLSPDDHYTTGNRAPPLNKKRREKYLTMSDEELREDKNFLRNQRLIDFNFIPEDLQKNILTAYEATKPVSRAKLFPYLVNNRLVRQIESLGDF